jgi:XRE family transcriptional regulator, fatty acid utilization regulator
MNDDYAKAFRIIRAAFGLKQSELAARMPITASQLSLIEAGKRQPSLRVVNGLANAVGVPAALISLLASTADNVQSNFQD